MIKEDKTTMQAVFSIGESENYNIVGSLSINESGGIYIDCIHIDNINNTINNGMFNFTGKTFELGKVLLLDCFVTKSNHGPTSNLYKSRIFCNRLYCVDNSQEGFNIKTSKMTFEIDDLEMWIAKSILAEQLDYNTKTQTYKLPETEVIDLGEGLSLTLSHLVSFSNGTFGERSEVKNRAFATFESEEEKDMNFFIDKGITLSNLVSFSLDSVCTIKNAYHGENKNNKVIFQSINRMNERKEINLVNHIFTLKSINGRHKEIVRNWFDLSQK